MGKGEIKFTTYERSTSLIKTRFEKIKNQVDAIAAQVESITAVQKRTLSTYLGEIQKKQAEFEGNLMRILESSTVDEAPQETLSDDQDKINDLYAHISSVIETLIPLEEPKSPTAGSVGELAHTSATAHVRLPKLELKHFDGTQAHWVSYINLFDTSVHHNPSVSNVAKLQYLIGSLSGEALNLIKSLNITPANYLVAYDLLRSRYHNTQRLQALHLNNLLDLPSISASAPHSVRTFLNSFLEHTQALKAL